MVKFEAVSAWRQKKATSVLSKAFVYFSQEGDMKRKTGNKFLVNFSPCLKLALKIAMKIHRQTVVCNQN